ncbi:hypothetical protein [Agrobacterium sp.]|uniref:hypothetical protein n=1 Tax=Agrobacterium sp. TaxID=361 RepID=UPI0028A8CF15|nr:hypothetical protein [Agrobacterium sp.]
MSRVSYFQRFSQRENHATNNTLLLLRYFYEESPRKLQQVLNTWLDEAPVEIGLTFEQQIRMSDSVPDGFIKQAPLQIYFESKHGGGLWEDQIERHMNSITNDIGGAATRLLIGLTREPSPEALNAKLIAKAADKKIIYRGLTYSRIINDLRQTCERHDESLHRILDDYQDFLANEGLLDNRDHRMVVFLCGMSLTENLKFGLYYEPPSRSCRSSAGFLGIYKNKKVHAIGRLQTIAVFSFNNGQVDVVENEFGTTSQEQIDRVREVVKETSYYALGQDDLRVYFVEKFVPTLITKTSPGGMMGTRYLNLDELSPKLLSPSTQTTDEIAARLHGTNFI